MQAKTKTKTAKPKPKPKQLSISLQKDNIGWGPSVTVRVSWGPTKTHQPHHRHHTCVPVHDMMMLLMPPLSLSLSLLGFLIERNNHLCLERPFHALSSHASSSAGPP